MKQQTVIPDAIRFAPLRAEWMADDQGGGSWCVMTRRDKTPGTLNNFSVAECQHKADATFFAQAPDLLRQRDRLREALQAAVEYLETHRPKGKIGDIFTDLNAYENGVMKPARAILAETEAA